MNWNKISLLSVAIMLGAVGGIGTFSTASVYAATAKESSTVYKQFGQYVSKPSTLAQARNYLINHIDEADTWTATRMTLQLENAQKAHLPVYSEKVFPENVQQATNSAVLLSKANLPIALF